jgi:hypothetical protein
MLRAPTLRLTALLAAIVSIAVLLFAVGLAPNAAAATAPTLGAAGSYAVLGGQTVTNTGPTTINGDLGVSPGTAVTNFPPGVVTGGSIHSADANALDAQSAVTTAYDALAAQSCTADLTGQDLGGLTLTEGVYCFSSSAQLTGTLTLDAQGNAGAVFVFKMVSTLTTADASGSTVQVINGSTGCNVFWQVGSSATIGTGTIFVGNILALTSIALKTGASVSGRALARNGAVTLETNHVGFSDCAVASATESATASATASPTASATATASPTATAAPTGTATATATSPAAATSTPTSRPVGPTPTPTATPVGQTPTPHITPCCLPRTGGPPLESNGSGGTLFLVAAVMGTLGAVVLVLSRMGLNAQTHSRRE